MESDGGTPFLCDTIVVSNEKGVFFMHKLLKFCLVLTLLCGVLTAPTVYRGYQLYRDAVSAAPVGTKVEEIKSRQDYVPLSQMSDYFVEEIIKSEDKRFYWHFGVDPLAVARAVKNDILAGSFVEGGSTITQQLAKNLYFDFEKVMERKVAEVFVAMKLEWTYSKEEILELYLNCIYFGENCYGIKEAAGYYYDSLPEHLTTSQSDSLVYTIKCPNLYNPVALAGATT